MTNVGNIAYKVTYTVKKKIKKKSVISTIKE